MSDYNTILSHFRNHQGSKRELDLLEAMDIMHREHEQERAGLLLKIGVMQEELEKLRMDGRRLDFMRRIIIGEIDSKPAENVWERSNGDIRVAIDALMLSSPDSQGDIGSSSNPPAQTVPAMECSTNGGGQVASPSLETIMALLSLAATVGLVVAGLKGVL